MKIFLPVILFSLPLWAAAMEVQPGDTLATVRTTLGAPRGQMSMGERHVLYYDRGEVELQGGTVARVALRSPDEQAVFAAERSSTQRKVLEENARQVTAGLEIKARKLSDSDFRATPLAYQVAFWESFAARYPGVSCREQLTVARLRLADEQAEPAPSSEPEDVAPGESDYVYPVTPLYSPQSGYGRNRFASSPVHHFFNPLLSLSSRPSVRFSPTLGPGSHRAIVPAPLAWSAAIRIRR